MDQDGGVPSFCVDNRLLGTDRHLLCTEDGFSWRVMVPAETWHLSGTIKPDSDWCLDSLLRLGNVTIDVSPPKRFVNSIVPLLSGSGRQGFDPPWQHLMPVREHRAFTKGLVGQVAVAMERLPTNYYRDTWVPGNRILRSLRPIKVDRSRWQALVDAMVGNVRVVETFKPTDDGFADDITYDRFGTLTGRLTVTSGPSILTLKREYRDIMASSTPGGCIVCVDFAALEARILLYEAGRRCDEADLYGMIAREMGGTVTRKAVKGAVISELYGSSKFALGKALGIKGRELNDFVRQVKAYFNTAALLKRIKQQFVATGNIINRYGRPVLIDEPLDNIFINYYAQSSGADVALLGFSQIVSELPETVRPLCLLHDGLFLDAPPEQLDRVLAVRSVRVPGYVQSFPVKVERLACTP